ncbi:MAG: BMC domain-containing protein [Clostridia bacterium]|jgi:ethanolamine utilization protein EutS|nr:BMC domain-containing protein [Clostridia bacterium]
MELFNKDKPVIVQEFVPGKQITLCHIIANPGEVLYTKLGLDPQVDYSKSAIGVLTIIPYEGAVIAADISMKSSGADIGFVDRFTGTLIITGSVSSVESAFTSVRDYFTNKLHYTCCEVTKT